MRISQPHYLLTAAFTTDDVGSLLVTRGADLAIRSPSSDAFKPFASRASTIAKLRPANFRMYHKFFTGTTNWTWKNNQAPHFSQRPHGGRPAISPGNSPVFRAAPSQHRRDTRRIRSGV